MDTENNQSTPDNQGASLDVNLDALSAPEGGYDPHIHSPGSTGEGVDGEQQIDQIPGDNGIPDGLPNLDELSSGSNEEPQGNRLNEDPNLENSNPNGDPNEGNPNNDSNAGEAQDNYWMKPFEQIKAANPEWEIPEGVNEENYLAVLQQIMTPQQPEIHPELMKMQEALNSGVGFDKIMETFQQSVDVLNMPDRDLLAQNLKETNQNWDDEKVKTVLDKLDNAGMLEIEAGKLRNMITQSRGQQTEAMRIKSEQDIQNQLAQTKQERDTAIKHSLEIINKSEQIYGLPISQAEKAEFGQFFEKLVTPDQKTGTAPMMDMLQSDETLVKLAMMMWKGDDKVRAALTDAKESGKQSVFGKLDKTPNGPKKGGGNNGDLGIDLDALSAPERFGGF